jgi:hypothetical protein
VASKRRGGEGSGRGVGLGLLFSLESKRETTRGRDSCPDLLGLQKGRGKADLLGRFAWRKKKERGKDMG